MLLAAVGVLHKPAAAQIWLGLGYDGLSQEYFLTVIDTTFLTPDSVDQLRRTATAINEGEFSLRSRVGRNLSWDQTTSYGSVYWQHRSYLSAYTPRNKSIWAGLEYRLNLKTPHDTAEASAFSDFVFHEVRGRLQKQFSRFALGLKGSTELVNYPGAQDLAYDYRQYRGDLTFSRASDPVNYQEVTARFQRRHVSDSGNVSYNEAGADLGVGWGWGLWRAAAHLELAGRRYDDDRSGLDFNLARLRVNWNDDGVQARWPGILEVESYRYRSVASLLADFVRADIRQRRAFPLPGGWSPYLEPGLEYVWSAADEDYAEPRLIVGTELFRLDGWWASTDFGVAHRTYPTGSLSGFSDFWRVGVNVFVNGPITRRLALSILYTQDWEWHTQATDNISVLLLSAGLRYRI
jgi:hypothetical protein